MTLVVVERIAVHVFTGEQPLRDGELIVGKPGTRRFPYLHDRASKLHPAQLREELTGINDDRYLGILLKIRPALSPDDGIQPKRMVMPYEPERGVVGAIGAHGGDPAGPLFGEKIVHFAG